MRNIIALLAGLAISGALPAAEWHVSVGGKKTNAGTAQSPWDLTSALAHPKAVKPGDTIWVHGGTYVPKGRLDARLKGTSSAPIQVRNYKGERAIIVATMNLGGKWNPAAYTWYRGLEICNGLKGRKGKSAGLMVSNSAEGINNPGLRIINCIIHDNGSNGIGYWGGAGDSEVHGCVIYNNGKDGSRRGHGHAIYTQNRDKPKLIKNNIMFRNFATGSNLRGSGEKAVRKNVTYDGNTIFNNGELSKTGCVNNIWIIGGENIRLLDNATYGPPSAKHMINTLGKSQKVLMKGNYFIAPGPNKGNAISLRHGNTGLVMEGNTFYGRVIEVSQAQKITHIDVNKYGKGNVKHAKRPTGLTIFVRKNDYEPGRANITVFNWDKNKSVDIDISKAELKKGDAFEIRDAQNWFGKPVVTGTYQGKPVTIPMAGLKVAAPIGLPSKYKTPPHTAPEFGVFVIRKKP